MVYNQQQINSCNDYKNSMCTIELFRSQKSTNTSKYAVNKKYNSKIKEKLHFKAKENVQVRFS